MTEEHDAVCLFTVVGPMIDPGVWLHFDYSYSLQKEAPQRSVLTLQTFTGIPFGFGEFA